MRFPRCRAAWKAARKKNTFKTIKNSLKDNSLSLNASSFRPFSNVHHLIKDHSVNRLTLTFVLSVTFGCIGVRLTAAQTAQPVSAQAPVAAPIPSTVVTSTSPPHGGANMPTRARSVRPNASESNQTAREPEQTKVARIYRGDGFFDAGLAKKLQPVLAQAFGVEPATDSKPGDNRSKSPDLLRSILGQNQGANQNTLAKTGQP